MKHKTEMPETNEPRLVSRRTLVVAAAWGVPAVTILGATPAYASSAGQDNVLSRPQSVTSSAGWTNPDNVKGIDDVTTYTTSGAGAGAPLAVSDFQIPINWPSRTAVLYVTLEVKWRVNSTQFNPKLQVQADYGASGYTQQTVATDSKPTSDVLHTFTVKLKISPQDIWIDADETVLTNMTVKVTPTATGTTEFYVDAVYLLIGYQWQT